MTAQREWFEKDYYAVLGVNSTASAKDITKAYRRLARQFHPDANPNDAVAEEKFKEISAAYDVIGDEDKRKEYDEVRRMGPMGGFGPGSPGGASFTFDMGEGGLGDILGQMFGGGGFNGRAGVNPRRGRDVETTLRLSFHDAAHGMTTTLRLSDGEYGTREVKVRIPAGVNDGQRIRLKGKGSPGRNGGPDGDLYIECHVGQHETFGREGLNLLVKVPVSFTEAALGATINVPTLEGGDVALRLKAGTQSGSRHRVKERGIRTEKTAGDLIVTVEVVVPTSLSKDEEAAIRALDEVLKSPRPGGK